MKPTNEIKKHDTMTVDDDKIVTVCKKTILSALNKIIAGDNLLILVYEIRMKNQLIIICKL